MSGYQKMIQRYGEMHQKADVATILDAWSATDRDMHVYVHSPFCSTLCRFCYYKGVNFDHERDAEIYDRFYEDYLPRAVAPFAPLIERSNVRNYFFGGIPGTVYWSHLWIIAPDFSREGLQPQTRPSQ